MFVSYYGDLGIVISGILAIPGKNIKILKSVLIEIDLGGIIS